MKRALTTIFLFAIICTTYAQIDKNSSYSELQSLSVEFVQKSKIDSALTVMEYAFEKFPEEYSQSSAFLAYLYMRAGKDSNAIELWKSGMKKGYYYQVNNPVYTKHFADDIRFKKLQKKETVKLKKSHIKHEVILPSNYDQSILYPVLFIFHGNSRNIEKSKKSWLSQVMKDDYISVFVQSYIHSSKTDYAWKANDDKTENEFKDIYNEIVTSYPVDTSKIIFSGMSAGGYIVLDFAFKDFVPISGVILNCPVIPDDISDEQIKQFVEKNKRIGIITGENDFALNKQDSLIAKIAEKGGHSRITINKGIGHEFAQDFHCQLDEYLRWAINPEGIHSEDISISLGHTATIKSAILNEDRELLIHLPNNYDSTNKTYPVLYQLDGSNGLMLETVSAVNRLTYMEELIPEIIVVAISNIDRNRDMWPTNTKYFPEPNKPGASSFLKLIADELIPYIETQYRCNQERIICGQSLSSVFVMSAFLKQPGLFNSYIATSAALPDCEEYFNNLADSFLSDNNLLDGRKIFISNGMKDPLDPDGARYRQMGSFSDKLVRILADKIELKYVLYENAGHVPFQSLYDGLRFIYSSEQEEIELPDGAFPIVYRGHLYIQGQADSVEGNFVFDTGASNLYYDTTYYADNEFIYNDILKAKLPGAGSKPQDVIVIKDTVNFTFGSYLYRTPRVPVLKLKPILGDFSDGIIGLEYFDQSILEINYEKEYMRIFSDIDSINLSDYCKIDLLKDGNRLYIPLQVNINDTIEISGNYQLDFGAGGAIGLTSSATDKFNLIESIDKKTPYYSKYAGVGGESSRFDFMAAGLQIGVFTFNNVTMNFSIDKSGAMASDKHFGLLGNGIYERFHVYIDFINNDLYIKPNSKYTEPFEFSRLGFSYVDRNQTMNAWIVTGLYSGCNAEKQGLKIDDEIIAVNGIGVDQISYESQKGFFESLSEVTMTINRNGELKEIAIKLKSIQ